MTVSFADRDTAKQCKKMEAAGRGSHPQPRKASAAYNHQELGGRQGRSALQASKEQASTLTLDPIPVCGQFVTYAAIGPSYMIISSTHGSGGCLDCRAVLTWVHHASQAGWLRLGHLKGFLYTGLDWARERFPNSWGWMSWGYRGTFSGYAVSAHCSLCRDGFPYRAPRASSQENSWEMPRGLSNQPPKSENITSIAFFKEGHSGSG